MELPVEEAAADLDAVRCLLLQGLRGSDEEELLVCHVGACHSGLVIVLLEVLDRLLLLFDLAEVLLLGSYDSLVGLLKQVTHCLPREQALWRVYFVWSFLTVSKE